MINLINRMEIGSVFPQLAIVLRINWIIRSKYKCIMFTHASCCRPLDRQLSQGSADGRLRLRPQQPGGLGGDGR